MGRSNINGSFKFNHFEDICFNLHFGCTLIFNCLVIFNPVNMKSVRVNKTPSFPLTCKVENNYWKGSEASLCTLDVCLMGSSYR